jgi:chemotaxis protein MotA
MDLPSIIGLLAAFGAILGGNIMEGGHTESLMQFTAAVIVLGGCLGCVLIGNTGADLKRGLSYFVKCFFDKKSSLDSDVKEVLECAKIARKESILALEKRMGQIENHFFRDALQAAIDGLDPDAIRDIFETRIHHEEEDIKSAMKVWTDAGGFCPTIGIIGAVLGLIHVMNNLSDPAALGPGIAVAFVATVYGVAAANILFLPVSNKIKKKAGVHAAGLQALLEGALMIAGGANPKIIELKLAAYTGIHPEGDAAHG